MFDCFVNSILSTVFSWELEAVVLSCHVGSCEMSEVEVFESVLPEILRKSIKMMSSWFWINAMFIVVIQSFHEHLRNILIINRED